jgi:hypothetical protein
VGFHSCCGVAPECWQSEDGKDTGAWNQLSVVLPIVIPAALTQKAVYKFPENTVRQPFHFPFPVHVGNTHKMQKLSASHISDLTALYASIVKRIINSDSLERNKKGIYFAITHNLYIHDVAADLAKAMHNYELIIENTTTTFESTEHAAEILGVPAPFVQALRNSRWVFAIDHTLMEGRWLTHNIVQISCRTIFARLGCKSKWNEKDFYANIDDEMEAFVELSKVKSSLIDSLRAAAKS